MADFFNNLAETTLGVATVVQPLIGSRYAPPPPVGGEAPDLIGADGLVHMPQLTTERDPVDQPLSLVPLISPEESRVAAALPTFLAMGLSSDADPVTRGGSVLPAHPEPYAVDEQVLAELEAHTPPALPDVSSALGNPYSQMADVLPPEALPSADGGKVARHESLAQGPPNATQRPPHTPAPEAPQQTAQARSENEDTPRLPTGPDDDTDSTAGVRLPHPTRRGPSGSSPSQILADDFLSTHEEIPSPGSQPLPDPKAENRLRDEPKEHLSQPSNRELSPSLYQQDSGITPSAPASQGEGVSPRREARPLQPVTTSEFDTPAPDRDAASDVFETRGGDISQLRSGGNWSSHPRDTNPTPTTDVQQQATQMVTKDSLTPARPANSKATNTQPSTLAQASGIPRTGVALPTVSGRMATETSGQSRPDQETGGSVSTQVLPRLVDPIEQDENRPTMPIQDAKTALPQDESKELGPDVSLTPRPAAMGASAGFKPTQVEAIAKSHAEEARSSATRRDPTKPMPADTVVQRKEAPVRPAAQQTQPPSVTRDVTAAPLPLGEVEPGPLGQHPSPVAAGTPAVPKSAQVEAIAKSHAEEARSSATRRNSTKPMPADTVVQRKEAPVRPAAQQTQPPSVTRDVPAAPLALGEKVMFDRPAQLGEHHLDTHTPAAQTTSAENDARQKTASLPSANAGKSSSPSISSRSGRIAEHVEPQSSSPASHHTQRAAPDTGVTTLQPSTKEQTSSPALVSALKSSQQLTAGVNVADQTPPSPSLQALVGPTSSPAGNDRVRAAQSSSREPARPQFPVRPHNKSSEEGTHHTVVPPSRDTAMVQRGDAGNLSSAASAPAESAAPRTNRVAAPSPKERAERAEAEKATLRPEAEEAAIRPLLASRPNADATPRSRQGQQGQPRAQAQHQSEAASPTETARRPGTAAPLPTIRVTIGRVEVRTTQQPETPVRRAERPQPSVSLDEYLRKRRGGDS